MTFNPEHEKAFVRLFDSVSDRIRRHPGCRHLTLLRDVEQPGHFTTFSVWDSVDHLNDYRASPLFAGTWKETKTMFAAPPVARSYVVERSDTDVTSTRPPTDPR